MNPGCNFVGTDLSYGRSPIEFACDQGVPLDVLSLVVTAGGKSLLAFLNSSHQTLLHTQSAQGRLSIVELFVSNGANVNAKVRANSISSL
jgi:ankyrin repeat protein